MNIRSLACNRRSPIEILHPGEGRDVCQHVRARPDAAAQAEGPTGPSGPGR